jgi:hypothetical protein
MWNGGLCSIRKSSRLMIVIGRTVCFLLPIVTLWSTGIYPS